MHHRYVVVRGTKRNTYDDKERARKKNISDYSENSVYQQRKEEFLFKYVL